MAKKEKPNKIDTLIELNKEIRDILLCNKIHLTTDQVCKYAGLKKSYLYKLIQDKEIPVIINPKRKRKFFLRADIDKWIEGKDGVQ